jgi:hypothetical protein
MLKVHHKAVPKPRLYHVVAASASSPAASTLPDDFPTTIA